ncbi:MAG: sulfurtransferase TusA family protein [Magnetococcus sp. YQC-9]
MISDPASPEWAERYSRQILLKEIGGQGQLRLGNSKVGLIADEKILVTTLLYLAGAGIGELRVRHADPEKIAATLAWAHELNPMVTIRINAESTPLATWLSGLDLLLDLASAWPQMDALCLASRIPLLTTWSSTEGGCWITGSNTGQDPALPCLTCGPLLPPSSNAPMEEPWASLWQGLAGTRLATEAIKYLLAIGDRSVWDHALGLDVTSAEPDRQKRVKNPQCPVCTRSAVQAGVAVAPVRTTDSLSFEVVADDFIDISGECCPMTFVRVKLLLEGMEAGQKLRVRLTGGEPLANVPRTLRDQGYVVSEPWSEAELFGLLVEKPGRE